MDTSKLIQKTYNNPRILEESGSNAWQGEVICSLSQSLWVIGMLSVGLLGAIATASAENILVFLLTSAVTLCLGHSLGMHRRFIHQSYECPKYLEYIFVYFGVLVGLAGPIGMMRTHDMRDWAQRQKRCHPYFGHKNSMLKDYFWQLYCVIRLDKPPLFVPEIEISQDRFYRFLEKTWMAQQLPVALLFYCLGGLDWIIWGVCLRVAVSVTGHWLIGYFAHNIGDREWHVEGAAVQGFNIKFCGLITMGECWHNNHHAFPNSALLGIHSKQSDPGWWVLLILEKLHLAWDIKKPNDLPARPELVYIADENATKQAGVCCKITR